MFSNSHITEACILISLEFVYGIIHQFAIKNIQRNEQYFDLAKEYGITPSMSKRGNCCDNAMAENFFSILKTECIYRHQAATFEEANILIDNYIYFYNHQRIQLKTGVAPLTLRHSA